MGRPERGGRPGVKDPVAGQRPAPRAGWKPAVRPDAVIVTCEHAGREVPREVAGLFRGQAALLRSHRGWDIGALRLAERLAETVEAEPHLVTVSRLVVDVNRSIGSRTLFSEVMRDADAAMRERILASYYRPHRRAVELAAAAHAKRGRRVLHVSVHTFTPVLNGRVRNVDIGVLFDPARAWERAIAEAWIAAMQRLAPALRIRRNLPYRGASDGFTTDLRRRFPAGRYAGLEIELNNAIAGGSAGQAARRFATETITQGLQLAIARAIGREHAHRGGVARR